MGERAPESRGGGGEHGDAAAAHLTVLGGSMVMRAKGAEMLREGERGRRARVVRGAAAVSAERANGRQKAFFFFFYE
jgi:hypothetical protein